MAKKSSFLLISVIFMLLITTNGFSINELDSKIKDSNDNLPNTFEPDNILEQMKAADKAMAKGFTANGTNDGQWTVTMGQDSCIIFQKLQSSLPTPKEIIEHNKRYLLGGRGEPVDVNSRPLSAFIVENRITCFDSNCSANKDCLACFELTSEEKVKMLSLHASINFEKPDSPSYSMPYRMYVWSLGRGFSKYINEITSAEHLSNGNLKCQATMRDFNNDSRSWEFIVDPDKDYLVVSATYFRNTKPYYKVDVNETSQVGDMFFAKKTSWDGPSGKKQIIYNSIECKPDLDLMELVHKELFGPYTTSADVHDETGSARSYNMKEIGDTYRLAHISLLNRKLPNIYGLCPTLTPEKIKEKQILVCFFDIEQRPSRNCILELNKKAKELEENGIIIIAIHTSKIEQNNLDEWVKENNISFPIGKIKDNPSTLLGTGEEQTLFTWGVKALPWLILTDEKHIVTNEGFSINELDETITR